MSLWIIELIEYAYKMINTDMNWFHMYYIIGKKLHERCYTAMPSMNENGKNMEISEKNLVFSKFD